MFDLTPSLCWSLYFLLLNIFSEYLQRQQRTFFNFTLFKTLKPAAERQNSYLDILNQVEFSCFVPLGVKRKKCSGHRGFHDKSCTYILCLVFSLSLFLPLSLSLYSNTHQQTLRANSTCLTRLSARWCERGRVWKTPVGSLETRKMELERGIVVRHLGFHGGFITDDNGAKKPSLLLRTGGDGMLPRHIPTASC